MASLQKRSSGYYRIIFCFGGKRFFLSLKTKDAREARSRLARLEENLHDLERGRLEVPSGADLSVFLLSEGRLTEKPALEKPILLRDVLEHYQANFPKGAKDTTTRYTEGIHIQHFLRLLHGELAVGGVTTQALQGYVDKRSQEKGRNGACVSHVTIRKEIGTFATIWNKWALPQGLVSVPSPTRGIVYGKVRSKPPFQAWEQIERQIVRGGLSKTEEEALWDALFLSLEEIEQVLEHVKANSPRFLCVMFAFAAHTGARRSEMLRSLIDDFDFASETVVIREKKKDRTKEFTFRTVPMSPFLKEVMAGWFAAHPGGQFTICSERSDAVSAAMSAHYFRDALEKSKWDVLKGWHVFRHSFASNCALRGVDQRLVDRWLGHQTEEMRLRYQHLFPNQQREAIRLVFPME